MKPNPSFLVSQEKDRIRDFLVSVCPSYGSVLTLAGPTAKDARNFMERKHARVSIIENSPEIFQIQGQNLKNKNRFFRFQGEALETLQKLDGIIEPYDLIFLDFCGPYSSRNEATFSLSLKDSFLKRGGVLALTIMMGREQPSLDKVLNRYLENGLQDYLQDRLQGLRAAAHHLFTKQKFHYKELEGFQYHNRKGDSAEMLFLCLRKL